MISYRKQFVAGALAVSLLGLGALGASAQAPAPAAPGTPPSAESQKGDHRHGRPGPRREARDPSKYIEGRIAFLKAELKITEAQTPAFNALAQVMRANAEQNSANMKKMREQRGPDQAKPGTIERLEMRAAMTRQMAEQSQRTLEATKPLYSQLSDAQKKTADELLNARQRDPRGPHKPMRG
jgi:uncharacterized protein (DUF305 family)